MKYRIVALLSLFVGLAFTGCASFQQPRQTAAASAVDKFLTRGIVEFEGSVTYEEAISNGWIVLTSRRPGDSHFKFTPAGHAYLEYWRKKRKYERQYGAL